jgi:limonene 1,2-monooxygenase
LQDARLQLRPYSEPSLEVAVAASISPTGAKAAGKHGIGLLSIAATTTMGFNAIETHWNTWNEVAAQHGNTADRSKWRLVGPMHLAETKEQALKDVEYGIVPFSKYFTKVLPAGPTRGETAAEIIDNVNEDGFAVIGTPDQAVEKIQSLIDASGGFGTFLLFGHDWANPEATRRSFELFAQYVMPHFTGQLTAPEASCDWVTGSGGEFVNRAVNAIFKAIADHADEQKKS